MKTCSNCKSQVEDNFQLCWNCNYSFDELKIVEIRDFIEKGSKELDCLRCNVAMVYAGNYRFHEGQRTIYNVFQHRESFDVYMCPDCGKAEFFFPEMGE